MDNRKFTLQKRKPSSKDYSHRRTLGTGVIPPSGTVKSFATEILNQGALNECTAYAAVAIRESLTGKKYDPTLFWAGELALGGTAEGVTIDTQGAAGRKNGWTVQGDTKPTEQATAYLYVKDSLFGSTDMFDTLREAMMNYGALSAGLDWYNEWTPAVGGIIPHTQNSLDGGHCVKLAGLECFNGIDYLIIQNSWGTSAGASGFYYLDRYMTNRVFKDYGVIYWINDATVKIQQMGLLEALCVNVINLMRRFISQKNTGYPPPPVPVPTPVPASTYLWDTHDNARHSTRLICDELGLPYDQKNILCAVLQVESGFNTHAINYNYAWDKDGNKYLSSTDYGICQWNDFWHGKEITPDEAVNNPEKAVRLMVTYWLQGKMNQWCAFTNGSYRKYL